MQLGAYLISFNGAIASSDIPHTQMVPAGLESIPFCYDVPDTIFLLDLGEQDCDILVPRRIGLDASVTVVSLYGFSRTDISVQVSAVHRRSFPMCAWLVPPCRDSVLAKPIIQQERCSGHAFFIFTGHYWLL